MTTKQRHIAKLGNAIRALKGSTFAAPEKKAIVRVERWIRRCQARGYL